LVRGERGRFGPKPSMFRKLAEALGMPVSRLVD
jgi:hypothetical protein